MTSSPVRRAARALLVTEAVLLACTAPVIGFLVLWGSVWEGSPDQLARRRAAVRWLLAAGVGNGVAFVLVVLALSQLRQRQVPWVVWGATGWVTALGIAWTTALGATVWPFALFLTAPPLVASLLLRRDATAPAGLSG